MGDAEGVRVVLVVGTDVRRLDTTAEVLRGDGHDVIVATTFEKARALLASSPDLLITDVQLGAYNGLHLVWQRYYDDPTQPSIVISTYPDPVLEIEAGRLGCPFLVAPIQPHEILTAVSVLPGFDRGTFGRDTETEQRRWPRTSVGSELRVEMEPGPATLVDVSYGGCRLRFAGGAELPIASSLHIPIPTLDQVISGTSVWRASVVNGDIYGVSVGGAREIKEAWRRFVDTVGGA